MKARFNIGQAPRPSQTSNDPLGRRSLVKEPETGATPVLLWLALLLSTLSLQLSTAQAQYTIDWHKIDGGGGTIGSAATATSPWANNSY